MVIDEHQPERPLPHLPNNTVWPPGQRRSPASPPRGGCRRRRFPLAWVRQTGPRVDKQRADMPHKLIRVHRAARRQAGAARPVMLGIAGDSAAGKTTLSTGLAEALGPDRSTSVCVDDYHRYDREERKGLPFTALHPDCNYVSIMEQHLQQLAPGQPILKPVYDHATGKLTRH